jgi:hypothetical protein
MSSARITYLILSILGFFLGVAFIYPITIDHNGFDIIRFSREIGLNSSSRLLAVDLSWSAITFFSFLIMETKRLKVKRWWLAVLGSFLVGVCFAFPLFLFLRQAEIEKK